MLNRWSVCAYGLLLFASCSQLPHGTPDVVFSGAERRDKFDRTPGRSDVMLGTPIVISTTWSKFCKVSACDVGRSWLHTECSPDYEPCDFQEYDVSLTCNGASSGDCPADTNHVVPASKGRSIVFVPTHLGDLEIEVLLRHVKGYEKRWYQKYVVWSPDDVRVESPVPAAKGIVALSLLFRGVAEPTTSVRVNGQPVKKPYVELAALFPDRRDGDTGGVQPGSYELVIEAGVLRRTVTVEAK